MKPAPRPVPKTESDDEPASQTERRWWWAVWLTIGIAVLAGCIFVVRDMQLHGLELSLFRRINNWPDGLYRLFLVATIVPASMWIAAVGVVVAFMLRLYQLAWQLAAATFVGYGLALAVMHWVGRPRPAALIGDVHQRIADTGIGFPSGHTMMITILVLTVWPWLPKGWRWLTLILIPLMGLSRVYLGMHAPLDIVGGLAIGVIAVALLHILPRRWCEILHFD